MIQSAEASLAQFVNLHSFTLLGAAAMLALAVILLRDGVRTSDLVAIAALGGGLALAYLLLRPGPSTHRLADAVLSEIGAGRAVLIELQSPY